MVQSWWFGCLSKTHTLLSCLCVHSLCSSPRVLLDSASACSLKAPAKPAPTSVLAKLAPAPAPAPTKSAPAPTTARSATATVRSATVPRSSVGRSPAPPVEEKLPPGELLQAFFCPVAFSREGDALLRAAVHGQRVRRPQLFPRAYGWKRLRLPQVGATPEETGAAVSIKS